MKDKIVIIVNGQGGAGKDTLCRYFCDYYDGEITSAITPFIPIAEAAGYTGGKSDHDRKFLSDLQDVVDDYIALSIDWIDDELDRFSKNDKSVLFFVIRKPEHITYARKTARSFGLRATTLVIRRKAIERDFGNNADDRVLEYPYEYAFDNDTPIEVSHPDFVTFIKIITDEVV